jgi:predicted nucleotidyltransferase
MINIKTKLIEIVHKHIPGCRIFLYGSRARGTHAQGADYDIALDAGEKIQRSTIWEIQDDIENSNIYVFVDILDINNTSPNFLTEITKDFISWNNE